VVAVLAAQSQDEPFSRFINTVRSTSCRPRSPRRSGRTPRSSPATSPRSWPTLRARTDGTIGISGSATLVRWLLAHDLLDALNLLVHPIAVGHGQRLFEDTPTHRLRLVRQRAFPTGVLDLTYAPAAD
jgi:dihydrofolate reductase